MNRNDFGFNWKIVIMYFYGTADYKGKEKRTVRPNVMLLKIGIW
jgi:hypothetical protein